MKKQCEKCGRYEDINYGFEDVDDDICINCTNKEFDTYFSDKK